MNLFLPLVNKNFMHLKVLLMNLKDVKNAAMHAKMLLDQNAKCSLQNVLLAEEKQKFLLDHVKTVLFTAVNASLR